MAKLTCSYSPSKGKDTFRNLVRRFGYNTAYDVFTRVTGTDFIRKYGKQVKIDSDGIPTFDSIMHVTAVRNHIGEQKIIDSYQKEQASVDNTLEHVSQLVFQAEQFNNENNGCIAIVDIDPKDSSKIKLQIVADTVENRTFAENQRVVQRLNEKMAELLRGAGVSIEVLDSYESSLGRVGQTIFRKAQDTVNGFEALIRIANNLEGSIALSEEFAHFVLGIYHDDPLVQRGINYCKDQNNARKILGEQYQQVYDYYQGDPDKIAEEAAGHIFQQALLDKAHNIEEITYIPLFKRLVNKILNFFKGLNPAYFKDTLQSISNDYSKLAQKILNNEITVTKKNVQEARRIADFNALSEKAEAQVEVLRKITENAFKSAALQSNLDVRDSGLSERGLARAQAEDISQIVRKFTKQEETMAGIASFLTLAQKNISEMYTQLGNLDSLSLKDKFTLLRNALVTIQQYAPDLDELQKVLTEEFLSDEHIANQAFVINDTKNELEAYTSKGVATKDTAGKTAKQVAETIVKDSAFITLSDDEDFYINAKTKQKSARVTTVIQADSESEEFAKDSVWETPSTNIGTGIDELTRDFFAGRINKVKTRGRTTYNVDNEKLSTVYPNAEEEQLIAFVKQLEGLKKQFKDRGITIVPRDVTVDGEVSTVDGRGIKHTISVAGTVDLLGYDKDGNWYIYDMKTHRGNISENKKNKYRRQLTLYKEFLEAKYGITVKEIGVLPIKVSYPTPKGVNKGDTSYDVASEDANPLYNGKRNNQLLANGEPFKKAFPKLEESMIVEPIELSIEYSKLANDPTNGLGGGTQYIKSAVGAVREQYVNFSNKFFGVAMTEFVEFLKPFVGETIKVPNTEKGMEGTFKEVPMEQVIRACNNGDVTLMQFWLSSMADNPDALLQVFDKVVKIQKDKHRLKTIEMSQRIFALGKKYEKLGIRSYDWMFEEGKMRYINRDYDQHEFDEAKAAYWKYLDEKYGLKVQIGSSEHFARLEEERDWYNDNAVKHMDGYTITYSPKPEKFPSKYNNLSDIQKAFYEEWMNVKQELDEIIGPEKTFLTNSIKIRKSYIERLGSVLDGSAIESFVEGVRGITQQSFDDDYTYGRKGIRNFDGSEYMKLPLYYVHAEVSDGKDLSTDVISTLIAYADMAYNYEAMNEVVNPLEIGRELVKKRKISSSKREVFSFAGQSVDNPVDVPVLESNMYKLLNDFFESKIYGRYLQDNGNIPGTKLDVNKAASNILKLGSTVQLGFNLLANMANILTGASMQNIEAAAGEHFNARILLQADTEFAKALGHFVGDIGQRRTLSKLALFDQLFDVRQNFTSKIKETSFVNRTFLTRIFGPGIQYIGQDAGDHWLYNRTAIAIALQYKMYDTNTGQEVSLWDALETVAIDPENPEAGNKLVLRNGVVKEDGRQFTTEDIIELSGKMRYVNQHLFGIYNQEDTIAARRTIIGRFAMQYRDFLPAQLRYRFGTATTNLEKGDMVEGYYRTTGRFFKQLYKELKNGEKNLKQITAEEWENMEDWEKANIRRSVAEVVQFLALLALCNLLGKSSPKDRPWAIRTLRYLARRERTELGALIPGPTMLSEGVRILRSPFAASNIFDAITNTTGALGLLWIPNYWTEVESGDYKGHSEAYKCFIKSPFSLWYKTYKRVTQPEKAEQHYK